MIAEDLAKGVLIDTAVERAGDICLKEDDPQEVTLTDEPDDCSGWFIPAERRVTPRPRALARLGTGPRSRRRLQEPHRAGVPRRRDPRLGPAEESRHRGHVRRPPGTLRDLISDEVRDVFAGALTPLWTEAWHLGYAVSEVPRHRAACRLHRERRPRAPAGVHRHRGGALALPGLPHRAGEQRGPCRAHRPHRGGQGDQLGCDPVLPGQRGHPQAPARIAGRVRDLRGHGG